MRDGVSPMPGLNPESRVQAIQVIDQLSKLSLPDLTHLYY